MAPPVPLIHGLSSIYQYHLQIQELQVEDSGLSEARGRMMVQLIRAPVQVSSGSSRNDERE